MPRKHDGSPQMTAEAVREALGPEVALIPLGSLREVDTNDIPNVTDTPDTDDPSGFAGILNKGSTPILEFINGDTDSCMRLNYASGDSDPVAFQVPLVNIDTDEDLKIYFRAGVHGSADTPTMAADCYFNEGDTKVEDVSDAIDNDVDTDGLAAIEEYSITVDHGDIPDGAQTVTVELTPGAHTTDALFVTSVAVEYWRAINYRV